MSVTLVSTEGTQVKLEVTIELSGTMLEREEAILQAVNDAGNVATKEALTYYDTDGSSITIGGVKWFSKGPVPKHYQTPYGQVEIARHVYQRSRGGATYCPLEHDARIVVTSTPRFAKLVSHKFANVASTAVQRDLAENHGRAVARSYLQHLADAVGSVAQAKEESWSYTVPKLANAIQTIALGMDGTCMLLCEDGYREAMVGTITLYDLAGERQYTIYLGATPEYGKAAFYERMTREIQRVKALYPEATVVGIADGAKANWDFLTPHTQHQILDFYHATEYLAEAAQAVYPRSKVEQARWLDQRCHDLKHKQGAASRILKEMEGITMERLSKLLREKLKAAMTYFRNHKPQMQYARYRQQHFPIGSGVTEAACKTLVKQRLCCSGMKWVERGAGIVMSLRALVLTHERWEQFWSKINQYGFQLAV